MAETELTLLRPTLFDNLDDRQVEFDAEGDGDVYPFAVQYRVLEALTAVIPEQDSNPVALAMANESALALAAARALARGTGVGRTVIGEGDLV
jgi:hypothetical protein